MADESFPTAAVGAPVPIEVFMDYHCPYSYRAVAWLDDLGPGIVDVRHRFFALEQVNHDPDATAWRIWEQTLDYAQYRDRQDRRSLAAFLATAVLEASEPGDVGRRFRRAVYAARFDDRADISDLVVLERAAGAAGVGPGRLASLLGDQATVNGARQRIADDWAAARSPYLVFGVPTLLMDGRPPAYMRLAAPIPAADGLAFLNAFRAFREAAPTVIEIKEPDAIGTS
jgi:hypothetical protein